MNAFLLIASALALSAGPDPAPGPHPVRGVADLSYHIDLTTVIEDFDGEKCWFHPRAGIIPSGDRPPVVVLTMQRWFVNVSDYFSGLSVVQSPDRGLTWTAPDTPASLGWREEPEGITVGVCDFTPGWHAASG